MTNLVSRLCGKIRPLSIKEYTENGGFQAFERAINHMSPDEVIQEIKNSNLKGRGGAVFPTGLKWEIISREEGDMKYIVCNADEGEPGTFKDKLLLEGCPLQLIEGMMIAAYAIGASKGYIYIRGEYPKSKILLKKAIELLKEEGYLGNNIYDKNFDFDIEVRSGSGAYICGEETALIESIEGKPGRSRFKPPYPPNMGLWGKPTLVNNVETLANIPVIISIGSEKFKTYGTRSSSGTKLVSVSGNVVNRGVFEIEFGTTLREVVYDICGGIVNNKKLKFVQLGGSSGAIIPESMLDIKLDFDELRQQGIGLGSGAILVVDYSICMVDFMYSIISFFKHESCGKCTPCREGNLHLLSIIDRMINGVAKEKDFDLLREIAFVMRDGSLCGLGQSAPTALLTSLEHFEDEYREHLHHICRAGVCSFGEEGIING